MAAVADSGAIYGLYNRRDRHHRALKAAIIHEPGAILISAAILSEIDYLIAAKLGVNAELDLFEDILKGAFTLEPFSLSDLRHSRELINKYRTLDIGLADAAVIATAERLGIRKILTVDERHFRIIRGADGKPFTLLPSDSQ
ncbi:MAG: PIN domain-containing protein [Bryobacterales bacterium]|nr:PIN domain-containing protein [Bryobacterales bacterium]